MGVRCPSATIYATGEIDDYQLVFRGNKSRAYLTIEPCEGETVPIVIWEITGEDERALDMYEGYPTLYTKASIDIGDGIRGFTYIMNEGFELGAPTEQYLKTCAEGYDYFNFNKAILDSAPRLSYNF